MASSTEQFEKCLIKGLLIEAWAEYGKATQERVVTEAENR